MYLHLHYYHLLQLLGWWSWWLCSCCIVYCTFCGFSRRKVTIFEIKEGKNVFSFFLLLCTDFSESCSCGTSSSSYNHFYCPFSDCFFLLFFSHSTPEGTFTHLQKCKMSASCYMFSFLSSAVKLHYYYFTSSMQLQHAGLVSGHIIKMLYFYSFTRKNATGYTLQTDILCSRSHKNKILFFKWPLVIIIITFMNFLFREYFNYNQLPTSRETFAFASYILLQA